MIRSDNNNPPQRRLAIVKLPQRQLARLGQIRDGDPPRIWSSNVGWSTISDQTPDNSTAWMATILRRQAQARLTTPGTYSYTPAPRTPAPNVAPWNSWVQPNCDPGAPPQFPGTDLSAAQLAGIRPPDELPPNSGLFAVLGLIGAGTLAAWMWKKGGR